MKTLSEAAVAACNDTNEYSMNTIRYFERMYGQSWISPGGETTTKDFLIKLGLEPGQRVLDVGCGTGGSAFYMAKHYGVHVHCVDISSIMLSIFQERLSGEDKNTQEKVKFELADVTKMELKKDSYDVIYSRDAILYIPDKEQLFRILFTWLKPGGTLFVTDYCRGDKNEQEHSQEFLAFVHGRGYDLRTVPEYGKVVEQAGFREVQAVDITQTFMSTLSNELKYFEPQKKAFIKDFSEKAFNDMVYMWKRKLIYCGDGDQAWGMFVAKK